MDLYGLGAKFGGWSIDILFLFVLLLKLGGEGAKYGVVCRDKERDKPLRWATFSFLFFLNDVIKRVTWSFFLIASSKMLIKKVTI